MRTGVVLGGLAVTGALVIGIGAAAHPEPQLARHVPAAVVHTVPASSPAAAVVPVTHASAKASTSSAKGTVLRTAVRLATRPARDVVRHLAPYRLRRGPLYGLRHPFRSRGW